MEVLSFFGQGISSNTFLLINESDAVIVDASCYDPLVKICDQRKLNVKAILLTHGHFDHTLCLEDLRKHFKVPVYIHKDDDPMLSDGYLSAYNVFFERFHYSSRQPADITICQPSDIEFCSIKLKLMFTPGHTQGSLCYLFDGGIFTGDTLFAQSVGRSDLPGGNTDILRNSLVTLTALPNDLTVYSGHGPNASLAYIKSNNYYLNNI